MHVGMGVFFQNPGRRLSDHAVWRHGTALADLAEPLGFDSVWGAEHHFDDYTMCPNVAQFLTWVAGRTRRAKLGSMVMVLPWHDPVRVAEEISVLDNLSDGRVILGIGRGLGRIEYAGFRLDMGESRGRFTEYAEALLQGLETGHIDYQGTYYRQPRVAVRPAPIRSFRQRSYAASISPQSLEIMCRLGVGLLIIAQKPWDTTEAELAQYRARFLEVNRRAAPKPIIATFVAVHEDAAVARDMFEKYVRGYCRSALEHYEFHNEGLADIPGYEYYGKLAQNIRKHGIDQFVEFLAELQVWGTPDQVFAKLAEHQRRADSGALIGIFNYGGMPEELARRNATLFAERVLPRLHAIDAGCEIGGGEPLRIAAE
ncbi:MAG TPA: LLM class flavin-dependent oxidoreductase [Candidatus Sulfotelmatobacter sp.]|nr:LLM class flavin-dependent oxidoreductase [Candidatus Sulfotelmatobacter sp.]